MPREDIHIHFHVEPLSAETNARLDQIMAELEDLQAAVASIDAAVAQHAATQAAFLVDIQARLAAAAAQGGNTGVDPDLLAPITNDINAQVAKLQALTAAEVAADPVPAAEAPADAPVEEPAPTDQPAA